MSEVEDRILSLIDNVTSVDEPRLSLLPLRETHATVELLQLLTKGNGEGAFAARHLAGNLGRRMPAAD
ncbi:hypothetical protein GCM10010211_61260 [Streptomyces albospinus]|uniref:Uncharacterized protein n=1 Tax=Streptomyces albospinus TaxID=285515 RepID=A0ABQ2VJJ1_9ACTN|nr:hypothetical protein [Streptomyces albospinus]GGU86929.1 hypothetical protein GCM10010211_61260 [Streptomyces albospinus]